MFANYLRTAYRHIASKVLYSAINVLGLAIGLACCLLILLYVRYESSFESGFDKADRIYRVSKEIYAREGARLRIPASNNAPVAPALLADYPQVIEQTARVYGGDVQLATDELTDTEKELRFADASILQIFNFTWLAGDPATALAQPDGIVLTETLARKYFGTASALGSRLKAQGQLELKVTGIIKDLPDNTHFSASGLVSLASLAPIFEQRWNNSTDFHTYVLLREGASIGPIEKDIGNFIDRHIGQEASKAVTMRVMNIRDIHLHSDRDEEWKAPGSSATVQSFIAIALSVLLIACINFMSIATARSATRAREVGMRKTLGASSWQLMLQFLGESTLVVAVSLAAAMMLAELLLPAFSALMAVHLDARMLLDASMLPVMALLLVAVSVIAGGYPAVYLAAFKPGKVLKGEYSRGVRGLWLRNALVVLQFGIAITLLIASAVIYAQRQYAFRFEVGFNKDQIVALHSTSTAGFSPNWLAFKEELLKNPAIEGVTASHFLPFGFNDNQTEVKLAGANEATHIQYMLVDYDFFTTYGIPLLTGRGFTTAFPNDSVVSKAARPGIVLNRSAAKALDVNPATAVGRELSIPAARATGEVVGVTSDIYFESLRLGERPLMFLLLPADLPRPANLNSVNEASIRIKAGQAEAALAHIDKTWRAFYPAQPLDRHFLNNDFAALYQAEQQQGRLLTTFAIIAVAIACFGLFGLASFNAERRTKEIGVRKVMGSSVWGIVVLLTSDFSRLVLLANVIAWPLAYYAMHQWLQNFAYRIDLTPLIFIGSGLIALCIAWVTVGGTAAKAASQKPVLALRYE